RPSSAATRPRSTSRIPSLCCSLQPGCTPIRARRRTSATPRSTCAPPRPPACTRLPSPGAASTTASGWSASSRTRSSRRRRSCLTSSDPAGRAAELRDLLNRALIAYHVEDEPIMSDSAYDALYDELAALEAEHP